MLATDSSSASAISRLPNELLSMIFESFVAQWESDINAAWGQLWRFLGVISLVSKHWNDVALRTPKIWRNIIHGDYGRRARRVPWDLQTFLTRSAEANLFLWIVPRHRSDLPAILAMPTKARVQRLHMYLGILPDAEHDGQSSPVSLASFAEAAKTLIHTTWPSLKHLSLTLADAAYPQERDLLSFLGRIDTLESLHIDGWPSTALLGLPPPTPDSTPTLSKLRTIHLYNVVLDDCCLILSSLSLPALHTLHLQLAQGDIGSPPPSTGAFASNLQHVHDLTLAGGLSPALMQTIFPLVPSLTSLSLVFKNRQQAAWTQLGFLSGMVGAALLPQLETLRIDHQLFWLGPLLPLLQSRVESPVVTRLRHLGVPEPFFERSGEMLQPVRELGLTVSAWVPEPIPYFLEKHHGKP